ARRDHDAVQSVVRVEHRNRSSLRLPVPPGKEPDRRPQNSRQLRALRGEKIMIVIPAIDLKDGRCVRLFQGKMDKETVYFAEPLEAAKHWAAEGAELIHVVDLNGAVEGRPVHTREIAAICKNISVPVELGGGLRSLAAVAEAFALGVARAIIGTAAYDNPELLREACQKFPGKIVVGIDARGGKVA